jgi:hypothetical protein
MSLLAVRAFRLPHPAPRRRPSAIVRPLRSRLKALMTVAATVAMTACTSPEVARNPPIQPDAGASTGAPRPLLPQARRVPTRIGRIGISNALTRPGRG